MPVQSHPPLKCIVCIAGIRPGTSVADTILARRLQTPSLHIIGDRDYVNKVALGLLEVFQAAVALMLFNGWPSFEVSV